MNYLTTEVANEALAFLNQESPEMEELENILIGYKFPDYQNHISYEDYLQVSYGNTNCPKNHIGIELVDDVDNLGAVYLSVGDTKALLIDFLEGE